MPSEIIQKETEINVEAKEIVETFVAKENGSQKTKTEDEVQINDTIEESKVTEELSESENKENEEPVVEDTESKKKCAENLLIDGKRHIIIQDFQAAVDVLSEACSLFGAVYGEMAEECAEAYFNYGCALLELSKDQISPVGLEDKGDEENEDVLIEEKSTEKEESLSKEEISSNKKETLDKLDNSVDEEKPFSEEKISIDKNEQSTHEEEGKLHKESMSTDDGEKPDEDGEKPDEDEEKPDGDEEKPDGDEEKPDGDENKPDEDVDKPDEDGEKPDEDVEDDVNDLQLAWEMLDLAKVIYKSKHTEESKLKLAEVLMKCGEVSIEDEKFETAIEDMTESLEIRRLLLPEDSRIIAETLFQLGLAHELDGSGERAIELLTEATNVLDQRMKSLENSTNNNVKEEVADIKSIIPEIQDRIVDIKERKKAAMSAFLAAVGATHEASTNGGASSSSTKQVSNIGHLIRKRPKQEETDGTPNKVPKLEELSAAKQ